MELQTAAVDHRIDELRRLAAALRLQRQRAASAGRGSEPSPRSRRSALRAAIGRRLVALGSSLLDDAQPGLRPASRT